MKRRYGGYKKRSYGGYRRKRYGSYRPKKRVYRAVKKFKRQAKHQEIHVKLGYSDANFGSAMFTIPTNVPAGTYGFGYAFQLLNCVGYSYYRSIFQYYRINKVVVKFTSQSSRKEPTIDMYSGVTQENVDCAAGDMWVAVDYSDETTPATVTEMMSYPKVKKIPAYKNFSMKFTPATLSPSYETVSSWGYTPKWKQWIRSADNNVPFYGMKWLTQNPDISNSRTTEGIMPRWEITCYAYVSFKDPIPGYTVPARVLTLPEQQEKKAEEEKKEELEVVDEDECYDMDDLKSVIPTPQEPAPPVLKRTKAMGPVELHKSFSPAHLHTHRK